MPPAKSIEMIKPNGRWKSAGLLIVLLALLYCCQPHTAKRAAPMEKPKGEFAFLLDYNGQMPEDVGFLTNHIVERRLANLIKDKLVDFMQQAKYGRPIMVDSAGSIVYAGFYSDSDRTEPAGTMVIDVSQDAMWVEYVTDTGTLSFTDHPSLPSPLEEE